jgi:protein-tyrosine phosphatase
VKGYVDLHCHYLPAIDDGVRTIEDGVRLVTGLHRLGWEKVVATPHIRTAMFDNRKPGLTAAYESFARLTSDVPGMPETGLGAEHFFDDVFWGLFGAGEAVPYPGGKAALVELPTENIPLRLEESFFRMQVKGVRPVLAHPERYRPLWRSLDAIDPILEVGAVALLDLMSLVGRYGEQPQRTAERMLEEGVYYAACTDCHKPGDVEIVARADERLQEMVGADEAYELLGENPRHILEGTVDLG